MAIYRPTKPRSAFAAHKSCPTFVPLKCLRVSLFACFCMNSNRLSSLPHLLLALLLTFSGAQRASAQGASASTATVSQAGVTPGAVAGATPATIAAPAAGGGDAAAIQAGDALFKANCTQCHAINEQVVGPALGGISKRRPITWIIPWIKNSTKVVASGDEYAVALYNRVEFLEI